MTPQFSRRSSTRSEEHTSELQSPTTLFPYTTLFRSLICNGYEAASGSVRIHDPAVQQKIFNLLGITNEEAELRFGFLLEALRYGAPPHAGVALGLDRWVMLFLASDNIRDVIAFPKTQKASDMLTGAPAAVDQRQLRDLHIKVDVPK